MTPSETFAIIQTNGLALFIVVAVGGAVFVFCSKVANRIVDKFLGKGEGKGLLDAFFQQLVRIANASVSQAEVGERLVLEMVGIKGEIVGVKDEMSGMKGEMSGMKDHISSLDTELGQVKLGLSDLTHEVKYHPPTKEKTEVQAL